MAFRHFWMWGTVVVPMTFLVLAGCSNSSLNSLDGLSTPMLSGVSTPPVHVVLSRGVNQGYTPAQIRHAYGFDKISGNGAGQTIAIIDAFGSLTAQKDLNTFCAKFGIPTTSIAIAYPTGLPTGSSSAWALETSLDVEWAHAIAPGARILLVVAKSDSNSDLLNAVNYAAAYAGEVSMSWGTAEFSAAPLMDSYFNKAGVAFVASSGDSGAGVQWPAVSPSVVSVGGTSLYLNSSGNRTSEVAWSGSGGGQSKYVSEPAYQTGWQTTKFRQVPDVSFVADPATGVQVYSSMTYQGVYGWLVVGGTSVGAPQWAALIALVNGNRSTRIASVNKACYALGSRTALTSNYYDILSGSNGKYSAATGYDMVTGLGTPLSSVLIPRLITSQ